MAVIVGKSYTTINIDSGSKLVTFPDYLSGDIQPGALDNVANEAVIIWGKSMTNPIDPKVLPLGKNCHLVLGPSHKHKITDAIMDRVKFVYIHSSNKKTGLDRRGYYLWSNNKRECLAVAHAVPPSFSGECIPASILALEYFRSWVYVHKNPPGNRNTRNWSGYSVCATIMDLCLVLMACTLLIAPLTQKPVDYKSIPDSDQSIPDSDQSIPDNDQSIPDNDQSIPDNDQSIPDSDQFMLDNDQSILDNDQECSVDARPIHSPQTHLSISDEDLVILRAIYLNQLQVAQNLAQVQASLELILAKTSKPKTSIHN